MGDGPQAAQKAVNNMFSVMAWPGLSADTCDLFEDLSVIDYMHQLLYCQGMGDPFGSLRPISYR